MVNFEQSRSTLAHLAAKFDRFVGWDGERIESLLPSHWKRRYSRFCSAGFVVAGRYHAVCLALRERIPFVAVQSNTDKIAWLLRDALGDTDRLSSVEKLDKPKSLGLREFSSDELASINSSLSKNMERTHDAFQSLQTNFR